MLVDRKYDFKRRKRLIYDRLCLEESKRRLKVKRIIWNGSFGKEDSKTISRIRVNRSCSVVEIMLIYNRFWKMIGWVSLVHR